MCYNDDEEVTVLLRAILWALEDLNETLGRATDESTGHADTSKWLRQNGRKHRDEMVKAVRMAVR